MAEEMESVAAAAADNVPNSARGMKRKADDLPSFVSGPKRIRVRSELSTSHEIELIVHRL